MSRCGVCWSRAAGMARTSGRRQVSVYRDLIAVTHSTNGDRHMFAQIAAAINGHSAVRGWPDGVMNMHRRCINHPAQFCLIATIQRRTAFRFIRVANLLTCTNVANTRESISAGQKPSGGPPATPPTIPGRQQLSGRVRVPQLFSRKFPKIEHLYAESVNKPCINACIKRRAGKLPRH